MPGRQFSWIRLERGAFSIVFQEARNHIVDYTGLLPQQPVASSRHDAELSLEDLSEEDAASSTEPKSWSPSMRVLAEIE